MMQSSANLNIDEYLRQRLMPVVGVVPKLTGLDIYGDSVPAKTAGGDLFEYIEFQERYDLDARIRRATVESQEFLVPRECEAPIRNSVDDHVEWLKSRPDYNQTKELEYRRARSEEQVHLAEDLQLLYETVGLLLVDAQGHDVISAKIASTVHDTFQAFLLSEIDHRGKTTPELFERLNLRLAQSVTARHALRITKGESEREIATMLYGEVHPHGCFRFVNFGHPPPLVFSAEDRKFMQINDGCMVRFLPLGLQIPEDHPDRNKYLSIQFRQKRANASDLAEITLMSPGDILLLYTDGVFDGSDDEELQRLESLMQMHGNNCAKEICSAIIEYAVQRDDRLIQGGEGDLVDDKTILIVKRL
jgi:serine phosphatase RsbU (regulator of sigma subunit)